MGQPVSITRMDHTGAELRGLAGKSRDGAIVRRLLAIAAVLDGHSRADAAAASGMQRQTLRDWVHRYNAEGPSGLVSRVSSGRPPKLNGDRKERLRAMVLEGPDADRHEVVRWRCTDLRDEIASQWSVTVHARTVAKWLHDLGMTRLQPRPIHPKKDPEDEIAFKKTSPRG